jgi:hypothetical protein
MFSLSLIFVYRSIAAALPGGIHVLQPTLFLHGKFFKNLRGLPHMKQRLSPQVTPDVL